jgi:hypothetical protein
MLLGEVKPVVFEDILAITYDSFNGFNATV